MPDQNSVYKRYKITSTQYMTVSLLDANDLIVPTMPRYFSEVQLSFPSATLEPVELIKVVV